MLIFGSTAIKHWFPDYDKEPKDIDYLTVYEDMVKVTSMFGGKKVEHHYAPFAQLVLDNNYDNIYLDANMLYTLKCSHLAWEGKNAKWWKYLKDAIFLQDKGCQLNKEFFDIFYRYWQHKFNDKSNISLNKATEAFFSEHVTRKYNHDELHEHFKILPSPAYKYALIDPSSPMMSEELFNAQSKQTQYYTALEEMFVVAYERNISLPNAYKALITKMTKGWWNLFLIQNAELLLVGVHAEKLIYELKIKEL